MFENFMYSEPPLAADIEAQILHLAIGTLRGGDTCGDEVAPAVGHLIEAYHVLAGNESEDYERRTLDTPALAEKYFRHVYLRTYKAVTGHEGSVEDAFWPDTLPYDRGDRIPKRILAAVATAEAENDVARRRVIRQMHEEPQHAGGTSSLAPTS